MSLLSWLLCLLFLGDGLSVSDLNGRALELLEAAEFDDAIALLERASSHSDGDTVVIGNLAVAHNNRGLSLLKEARYHAAIRDFADATRLVPTRALFRVHLGYAYLLARDLPRAESVLLAARARHPDEPKVYDFLGFLYYTRDELDKAVEAFEFRLTLGEDDWASKQLAKAQRELAVSGEYVDRSSDDFTLKFLGSEGNYAIADDLLTILEDSRARVCSDLGHYPLSRTTVLLYSDQDFRRATGAHGWVGGLYDGKIRLPVRDYRRQRGTLIRTVRHEYAHRVIAELAPGCPIWLNEGLAEWFEQSGSGAHDAIRQLVRDGAEPPSFAEMPKSFAEESDVALVKVQYAASRSFVAFLRQRYGLGATRSLLAALGNGDALEGAMKRNFGSGLEAMEALWRAEILP